MTEIRFPEFLPEQEGTTYPFHAAASLTNGRVQLLDSTFLDVHLYPLSNGNRHYLSSVTVTTQEVTLVIGDSRTTNVATGKFTLPPSQNTVKLLDENGRPAGVIVSTPDRLAVLVSWGTGTHSFELGQTEFCVTCQLPAPSAGVTGLRLPDGQILTGKVWLVGEDGVVLQHVRVTDAQGKITDLIQANVVGDPLYLQRLCNPESLFVPANPVRVIRVVNNDYTFDCGPDDYGNFSITVNNASASDAALRVRTTVNGIVMEVEGSTQN